MRGCRGRCRDGCKPLHAAAARATGQQQERRRQQQQEKYPLPPHRSCVVLAEYCRSRCLPALPAIRSISIDPDDTARADLADLLLVLEIGDH
jgi:hypothetical protein